MELEENYPNKEHLNSTWSNLTSSIWQKLPELNLILPNEKNTDNF